MSNRKRCFVKIEGKWQGPYSFFHLWFLAVTKKIFSDTFIWYASLDKHGEQRPENSIGIKQRAESLPFMRRWMFQDYRRLDRDIKRHKEERRAEFLTGDEKNIFAKPHKAGILLENAIQKNIIPTFSLLQELACGQWYQTTLSIKDNIGNIHQSEAPIFVSFKIGKGFDFETYVTQKMDLRAVLHLETYGLDKKIFLSRGPQVLEVPEGCVSEFNTQYSTYPQVLRGRLDQLSLGPLENFDGNYLRLVIPGNGVNFNGPIGTVSRSGIIQFERELLNLNVSDILGLKMITGVGYTEVNIGKKTYHFYKTIGKEVVIDSCQPELLDDFKSNTHLIRTALAFLSGSLYQGHAFYFYDKTLEFNDVQGVYYEKEDNAILSKYKLIDPIQFREYQKFTEENQTSTEISVDVFNMLCEEMHSKFEIKRSIQLVVNGMGNTNPLQQAALYAISLETLTNYLAKSKNDALKPIADEALYEKILKGIEAAIEPYKDQIPEDKLEIFKRKIDGLNTPPNQDVLTKTFGTYGVILTTEDIAAISTRNDYLHGRIPKKMKDATQWQLNAFHLHTLIGRLILKTLGYSGYIINLHNEYKFQQYITKYNMTEEIEEINQQIELATQAKNTPAVLRISEKLLKIFNESAMHDRIIKV